VNVKSDRSDRGFSGMERVTFELKGLGNVEQTALPKEESGGFDCLSGSPFQNV
jgi:hypothetical protein